MDLPLAMGTYLQVIEFILNLSASAEVNENRAARNQCHHFRGEHPHDGPRHWITSRQSSFGQHVVRDITTVEAHA